MIRKNFLKLLPAALTMCLVGCTEYDGVLDGLSPEYIRNAEKYESDFVNHFGQISSDQNWGFGEMPTINSGMVTRGNVPNRNQWADPNYYDLKVPGYPDAEGTYFTENGYKQTADAAKNCNPIGDVTDEEIQYVSQWFREHKNPESKVVHWSEFFIQNISADSDRELDANGFCNGKEITQIPIKIKNADGEYVNWYDNGNLRTEGISYYQDQLKTLSIDNEWDHIYDFNAGNTNQRPIIVDANGNTTINSTSNRKIGLYRSSGTEDFSYICSYDSKEYHNYVVVPLTFDIPQTGHCKIHNKNCTNHHYEGYYLAFDYEAHKYHEDKLYEKNSDGFYSNWIMKITPAVQNENELNPKYTRIMCEDLGTVGDYDFNDVVFDVSYEVMYRNGGQETDAIITLQAAGGTLPIYLGANDANHEIHHLFGQEDVRTVVNVGSKGETCPVAIFRMKNVNSTNPNNISVCVHNGTDYQAVYKLEANEGEAPQKICVPTNAQWTQEMVNILEVYPFFDEWVSDGISEVADEEMCYGWSSATNNPLGGEAVSSYDPLKVVAKHGDSREVNTVTYADVNHTKSKKLKVWHSYAILDNAY